MKPIALILVFAVASVGFAGIFDKGPPVGPPFRVHGRLSFGCGTPSCRIWIVGTKRILGVAESDPPEVAFMPSKLSTLLTTQNLIFGDFTVVPLTNDEDGVMRMVRVIRAENMVVTDWDLKFLRRIAGKIEEPNQSPHPTQAFGPRG